MQFEHGPCGPTFQGTSRVREVFARQRGMNLHMFRRGQPCGLALQAWPQCSAHGNVKKCLVLQGYLVKKMCSVTAENAGVVASQGRGSWGLELFSTRRGHAENTSRDEDLGRDLFTTEANLT